MALFLYTRWLNLSLGTRQQIALALGIAKTRPTHVFDNRIQDDGYNIHDVENALSIENIQRHLESTEANLETLFDLLVNKVEGRTSDIPKPLAQLTSKEAEKASQEYEERTGLEAPRPEASPEKAPKKPAKKVIKKAKIK